MNAGLLTRRLTEIHARAAYKDYPSAVYRSVFAAISQAWRMFLDEESEMLTNHSEIQTTICMQVLLEELRTAVKPVVSGFTSRVFETVTRDGKLVSHDGQHLEKQPDLTFRLVGRSPGLQHSLYQGIFVECKIVGRSFPVRLYCRKGIHRFVRGEYAWAMPTGVMIAYTRDHHTVPEHLNTFLAKHRDSSEDPFQTKSLPKRSVIPDMSSPPVFSSIHARPASQNGRPGDIRLHHLWLD